MSTDSISREAALGMVAAVEKAFGEGDIDAIMSGFTDDVVVRFADQPEISGKTDVRKFLEARFARQKGYRLQKRLRMLEGNMLGNFWDGEWEDTFTGRTMLGRGTEFWTEHTTPPFTHADRISGNWSRCSMLPPIYT